MTKTQQTSTKKTTKKKEQSLIAPNTIIKLTIPSKKIQETYQKNLKKMASKIKTDGFRKGKAPLKIAEEKIGKNKIIDQVLQELVPAYYQEAIKKDKKTPLTNPRFNPLKLKLGENFELEAHFAEKPEVKLGTYKKIVKNAKTKAEKEIKAAEKEVKKTKPVEDQGELRSKRGYPGVKKTKAGKDQKTETTKLSDAQKQDMTLQLVFKDLITELKPAIPQLLVEEETEKELKKFAQNLSSMKIELEDYLKSQQMTFESLSNQMAASSLGRLQLEFILGQISEEEKIEVTQDEIKKKIDTVEDAQIKKKMEKDAYYQAYLKSMISRQKVIDFIKAL